MLYISLIIDCRAQVSIVNMYMMVYSGFGCDLRFDLDLSAEGQIKNGLYLTYHRLRADVSMMSIYIMLYFGFGESLERPEM